MDPKDTTDPFAKYGAKADEDPFAKYGAKADELEAPAPIQAAQTSISQAFNKPAKEQDGLLSRAGEAAAGFGSGVGAGVPFGLGPSIVAAFSPETTEQVEQDIQIHLRAGLRPAEKLQGRMNQQAIAGLNANGMKRFV
jgi:hypothetical protein